MVISFLLRIFDKNIRDENFRCSYLLSQMGRSMVRLIILMIRMIEENNLAINNKFRQVSFIRFLTSAHAPSSIDDLHKNASECYRHYKSILKCSQIFTY